MKKKLIIILLLTFISTAINAEQNKDSETNKQKKCPRRVKVITKTVTPNIFKELKDIKKNVLPSKETSLFTNISGIVKSIEKTEGDEIKSGDIILTLDAQKFKRELKVQKERVKTWKIKLFKRRNWKTKSARAEKQAETIINDAKNKIKDLTEKIQNSVVIANVDGILGKIKVNVRDLLSNNFVVCSILNLDEIKINVSDYSDKINDMQKIKVYIEELSEFFEATAKKNETGSISIYIHNSNKAILKGMTAKFTVLINRYEDAITLPKNLILKENSIRFVYIVNGKRAKKAVLDTGHIDKNGNVLITNGLKANDELIISELLSTKTGTLSNNLRCIDNEKKIKVMALDNKTGKYKKVKYKKAPYETTIAAPVKTVISVPETKTIEEKQDSVIKIGKETEKKQKEEIEKERNTVKKALEAQILADKEKKRQETIVKEKERNEKLKILYKEKTHLETQKTDIRKKLNNVNKKINSLDKKSFFGRFSLGATFSYNKMSLENFEDVYGRLINPGIDIAFEINDKIDIYFNASYSSKTATVEWATEDLIFKNLPISLDIRYKFAKAEKFNFLGGIGLNYFTFEDVSPIETLKDSILGFNILAGTQYKISRKVSLNMLLKMNFVKKDMEATELTPDNAMDLGSIELLFGVSFKLGK